MTKRRYTCTVPGCGRKLNGRNLSGVCPDHRCVAPYCKCRTCLTGNELIDLQPDETKRIAHVPYVPGCSGRVTFVKVSLPREPWA